VDEKEPKSDRIRLGRRASWISRSFGAILADLELVECGSLDVLLYCADDLAVTTPGDLEADQTVR
jgi:hypothetical protein